MTICQHTLAQKSRVCQNCFRKKNQMVIQIVSLYVLWFCPYCPYCPYLKENTITCACSIDGLIFTFHKRKSSPELSHADVQCAYHNIEIFLTLMLLIRSSMRRAATVWR